MPNIWLAVLIVLALSGIAMLTAVGKKAFKKKGFLNTIFLILGIALVGYGVVGMAGQFGLNLGPADQFFLSAGISSAGAGGNNGGSAGNGGGDTGDVITYQPTATYTAKDKFSTTTVSGTSYYKAGNSPATTTAKTNVNKDVSYTYWVSNGTYWVQPVTLVAQEGVNDFVATAWQNGSATVSLYDQVGRASATAGASNVSMGANANANIEVTYQGTAKQSAGPFGGIMVAEYNSTISQVTCTGNELLDNNPYHLTYTTSATTHTFKPFAYGPSLDDGSGSVRRIDCQFKNGATAVGAGSPYYLNFIPANYYVSNAGDILLDTEKFADGDSTRTGSTINLPTVTGYWGA